MARARCVVAVSARAGRQLGAVELAHAEHHLGAMVPARYVVAVSALDSLKLRSGGPHTL